jgi:beta-fructofuranosidase
MYLEFTGSRKTLGDVDILYHDGTYHLFHLVLPNHDYIAHAISRDGLHWTRVENAIFVGHPGAWDDSMLWTMHVTPDPHRLGSWRMFYTGISRRDQGLKQRVGLALSDDLYHWRKAPVAWTHNGNHPRPAAKESSLISAPVDTDSCYPLEPSPDHYESDLTEGRQWVSWRDPFYFRDKDQGWLLCSGRVKDGPIVRRGCVAAMEEVDVDHFVNRPPLHHPGLYDDVEVPNLFKFNDEYYLIGSMREDAKVRYWHTKQIGSPWQSYYDNVLLGEGNYAGRICPDPGGFLIWSFFTRDSSARDVANILPPPKRLVRTPSGLLRVQSFEKILQRAIGDVQTDVLQPLNPSAAPHQCGPHGDCTRISGCSGFQAFLFDGQLDSCCLSASVILSGPGKCGIVLRLNRETHDAYYLSLDLMKGVAQIRDWGTDDAATGEKMMRFESLQSGYWYSEHPGKADIQLIAFGSYLELSIDNRVVLCLANSRYEAGAVGFYVESAELELRNVALRRLKPPSQSDEHLAVG